MVNVGDCFVCGDREWPHAAAVEAAFGRNFFETMVVGFRLFFAWIWRDLVGAHVDDLYVHINVTADILVGVFCSSHHLRRLRLRGPIVGAGMIQYFFQDFDAFCRLLPGCRSVGDQLARFVCFLSAIVDGRAAHVHSSAETGICIRTIELSRGMRASRLGQNKVSIFESQYITVPWLCEKLRQFQRVTR
jgi:hypothetical protein